MRIIKARNVTSALDQGVALLKEAGVERPSRNGPTIEVPAPVATQYVLPQERVLFNHLRNANPFFHFFEALWMLAGRNDIDFPARFVPRMRDYSDDGEVDHGAYGFRWREWFGFDQLKEVIKLLQEDPGTRRAVLQMWSPSGDLVTSEGAGGIKGKDIPCNTAVYFKVRDGALSMTVTNRSNDVLWGAYGANAVHMSMLQEYVANKVGAAVGTYYQVSDSYHVYTTGPGGDIWARLAGSKPQQGMDPYTAGVVAPFPLGAEGDDWDADLKAFFTAWDDNHSPLQVAYQTVFFKQVVSPLWEAWRWKDISALHFCRAEDWSLAGQMWLGRRAP